MKILLDMNLAPRWVDWLSNAGHEAAHWSTIDRPDAPDPEIMAYAKAHDLCAKASGTAGLDANALNKMMGSTAMNAGNVVVQGIPWNDVMDTGVMLLLLPLAQMRLRDLGVKHGMPMYAWLAAI